MRLGEVFDYFRHLGSTEFKYAVSIYTLITDSTFDRRSNARDDQSAYWKFQSEIINIRFDSDEVDLDFYKSLSSIDSSS